jgi:CheY-like chemotaxis protein
MRNLRLLIVDDDEKQIQLICDAIREYEKEDTEKEFIIESFVKNDKDSALAAINDEEYDFAVIDLKLNSESPEAEGNILINEIKSKMRFPVIVLSAFLGDLAEEISTPSDVFIIQERSTANLPELIKKMVSLHKSGIGLLFAKDGILLNHINNSLNKLFWVRIAKDWNYLIKRITDYDARTKIIAKQLSALLKEEMHLNDYIEGKSDPLEMYLIPPIRKNYYTGDILSKDGDYFIILTPACDMEIRENGKPKTEFVVISKLVPLKEHSYYKECWNENVFVENKKSRIIGLINSANSQYHLLPPSQKEMGFVIDFANVLSEKYDTLVNYQRKASITEPYLKNILSRFSNHFNRLGQPDFEEDTLLQEIKSL